MKRAKKFPFLKIRRQRFALHFDNASSVGAVPSEQQFYRWAAAALGASCRRAQISLILLDEEEARACNRDYRGKDYATNVLSFALNEGEALPGMLSDGIWGDLVMCPQVVLKEAAEQGKTAEQHFAHLTVHGTLHLMGYDHIGDEEAEAMETLETRLLNRLGYPDPYQESRH